jgi:diguanylate cyclase (GGDEF)-like protein
MALNNLKIRTVNLMVSGMLGFAGVCLAIVLAYTIHNVRIIEQGWYQYQADRSEKARLESVLRASIGYGGMIHEFKNYILRQNESHMDNVQANIGAARAVIGQYRSLGLSEAEKVALEDISTVLNNYDEALFKARNLIERGHTLKEIDEEVKVDDSGALRGLDVLRSEVARRSGADVNSYSVKGRVAANLRAAMGYGAMIHEFKNLVLRGDLSRADKVSNAIFQVKKYIAEYRSLGQSTAERIALDDIEYTINKYEDKLSLVIELIQATISVSEVDAAAKIDDSPALRGLGTLDKEIAFQVDALAQDVSEKLSFLTNVLPYVNWTVLSTIVIVVVFSVRGFQIYVIKPISRTTSLMDTLAADEVEIRIPDTDRQNEIGQMARALETFRQNIIGRQKAEAEIREIASMDALTGLDNRKRFEERLAETISIAKRMKTKMACMMIDLDKFKAINDTFGHPAGDEVLRVVAKRLTYLSRETDFVARLGGDEFAMILTVIDDGPGAELPAKRIIDQFSLPIYFEGHELGIGGSIGIAIYPENGNEAEELIRTADEALYLAKNAGRNTFKFAKSEVKKANRQAS